MNLKLEELDNVQQNEYIKEKCKIILDEFNSENKNNSKIYQRAQALLEFINVKILTKYFKINLPDFDIIRLSEEFRRFDQNIFEELVSVNYEYNTIDFNDIKDLDVITLMYHIDSIMKIVLEKYPKILY